MNRRVAFAGTDPSNIAATSLNARDGRLGRRDGGAFVVLGMGSRSASASSRAFTVSSTLPRTIRSRWLLSRSSVNLMTWASGLGVLSAHAAPSCAVLVAFSHTSSICTTASPTQICERFCPLSNPITNETKAWLACAPGRLHPPPSSVACSTGRGLHLASHLAVASKKRNWPHHGCHR